MKKILLFVMLGIWALVPMFAHAADPTAPESTGNDGKGKLPTQGNVVSLVNPLGGEDIDGLRQGNVNLPVLLGKIIQRTLGILGTVALLVFVYAGFQWVTAAGNSEKVAAGANAMLWSAVGICIIFSSYAILKLIFETLLGPGAMSSNPTQVIGKACYCTVNGKADTAMTNPADGFTGEAGELACGTMKDKEATFKSGDIIKNCTWK